MSITFFTSGPVKDDSWSSGSAADMACHVSRVFMIWSTSSMSWAPSSSGTRVSRMVDSTATSSAASAIASCSFKKLSRSPRSTGRKRERGRWSRISCLISSALCSSRLIRSWVSRATSQSPATNASMRGRT